MAGRNGVVIGRVACYLMYGFMGKVVVMERSFLGREIFVRFDLHHREPIENSPIVAITATIDNRLVFMKNVFSSPSRGIDSSTP